MKIWWIGLKEEMFLKLRYNQRVAGKELGHLQQLPEIGPGAPKVNIRKVEHHILANAIPPLGAKEQN